MFAMYIDEFAMLEITMARFAPTHIISLMERMEPLPAQHPPVQHLHVAISDVNAQTDGYTVPTESHLMQVLDFTAGLGETDRLLIHCFAGISRSTAIAIAVAIQHGLRDDAAFALVARLRPILSPNTLLIHLTDRHFDLHGALERRVQRFLRKRDDRWMDRRHVPVIRIE